MIEGIGSRKSNVDDRSTGVGLASPCDGLARLAGGRINFTQCSSNAPPGQGSGAGWRTITRRKAYFGDSQLR